ncbi:hypothetical protein OAJ24_01745 [Candidatus Pelagibacter sp.]|mgnify:FL=1|nr:hypothetical protein [Candidatus Pelagibacter sp.]
MTVKNILIVIFIFVGLYIVLDFRDHNFKRAIDACIAGSKKLDKPMTTQQAKEFCEDQINKGK